jgi:type VI secretion system protein ImpB
MANKASATDFIGRNRPPRVHIHYEVYKGNATERIELPFVMGVMSDLSGDTKDPVGLMQREFRNVDVGNFEGLMKDLKPSANMVVDNALTGEGKMGVKLTFESMNDFTPGAIARKVPELRSLMQARVELRTLLSTADGNEGADKLLARLLEDTTLQKAIATQPEPSSTDKPPKV